VTSFLLLSGLNLSSSAVFFAFLFLMPNSAAHRLFSCSSFGAHEREIFYDSLSSLGDVSFSSLSPDDHLRFVLNPDSPSQFDSCFYYFLQCIFHACSQHTLAASAECEGEWTLSWFSPSCPP